MVVPYVVDLRFVGTGDEAVVLNELRFETDQYRIVVKPGLTTDGATVPEWARWLVSPFTGRHRLASILHDALYASELVSRKTADRLYLQAMEELRVPDGKRWVMYSAVRLRGHTVWAQHTRASIAEARKYVTLEVIS